MAQWLYVPSEGQHGRRPVEIDSSITPVTHGWYEYEGHVSRAVPPQA
jgi:hypothetical protein